MPLYPSDLETIQWAREATKGTDLATTSKVITTRFNPTAGTPPSYRPEFARGLMLANRGGETTIQRSTNWECEGPLTFEQAPNWFNGAIANVASPTGLSPYVWTHTRNPAVLPTICSYTFERRATELVTPIDHAWHFAMVKDLELTFDTNQVWMYKASGFARRIQTETLTAAITMPSHEICVVPGTKVWIDSTFATLGTTQVVGQVLKGSIKFGSGATPVWTADGRTDLDFTVEGYTSKESTCVVSLTMLLGPQFAIEKAAAEAQTLRAVRVQIDGTSASRQIQMDMLLKYSVPELFGYDYDNELTIVKMDLEGSTDATNAWLAKVTNLTALLI